LGILLRYRKEDLDRQFSKNANFFLKKEAKKRKQVIFYSIMNFYRLPILLQWIVAIILLLAGFYVLSGIDALWKIPLVFIALPLLQFCCTPLFRLLDIYKTLSPSVYTIFPNSKKYELHNITTFDYLQTFNWSDRGKVAQRQLLLNYGKAFLYLIEQIEAQKIPESVFIVGHSYFFSERTTEKLGFQIFPSDTITTLCSCLNAIELIGLYSFSQGKWAIPRFWRVKAIVISGEELCLRKEFIQRLIQKIEKKGVST